MALRARFIPKNPGKYMGNPNGIFCRSSWELIVCKFLDSHPSVFKWGSEELKIPYIKPTDGKIHHYFPDFLVIYKDKEGNILKEILEVKPLKESVATPGMSNYDKAAFIVNQAKWEAAAAYANANGMTFRVLTEESILADTRTKGKKTRAPRKPKGTVKPRGTRKAGDPK